MKNKKRREELLQKLTIGISAYNDWRGLQKTLKKIEEIGLGDVQMVIVDDGSREEIDFDLAAYSMPIRFKRFEKSLGCVVQRNNLSSMVETKYFMSIDDDSYPVNGDVCDVLDELERDDDIAVMALDVRGPREDISLSEDEAYLTDVMYFVNCGCIIRNDYFKASGGYQNPDHLGWIFNEELDYSIRCWRDGKKIRLDRRFVLVHDRDLVDGQDSFKSSCYAKGLGYLSGRYYNGMFALYKIAKVPFMMLRSKMTRPFWFKSVASFVKAYASGVADRKFDKRKFVGRKQWSWDRLDLPPYA